jgi:hypothetical protein
LGIKCLVIVVSIELGNIEILGDEKPDPLLINNAFIFSIHCFVDILAEFV